MTRVDRLITGTVLRSSVLVAAVVIAATWMASLVDELGARSDAYTLAGVTWYVTLVTPERALGVFPLIALIGTLLGLSALASTSQLLVMRASGMSTVRLFGSVCIPVTLLSALAFAIGESAAPYLAQQAELSKQASIAAGDMIWLPGGRWHLEQGQFVHARALGNDGSLYGVSIFTPGADHRGLAEIRYARRAVPGDDGLWHLTRVRATRFDPDTWRPHARVSESGETVTIGDIELSQQLLLEPQQLSIRQLLQQIDYRSREGLAVDEHRLALWSRAFAPLAALAVTLVAMGFVIGSARNFAMGARLALGVGVAIALRYALDVSALVSIVYGVAPPLAVAAPIAAVALLGAGICRRA